MRALLLAVQDLFAVDADLCLDEVCTWLAFEHNIIISLSTLSRTLEQAGLTRNILQKLTAECDDIRREEAEFMLTMVFSDILVTTVLFSDRSVDQSQTVFVSGFSGWQISPG
ncbi:hypothetical protein M405DRAFT_821850 [Rhizopogon salebrosus TDB-379]|nr:hypothetical protein M405DRAFT_821850 [Rhizopogon salebrosus TDB-379]